MAINGDSNSIISIFTAIAAISAAISAYLSYIAIEEQRKIGFMPVISFKEAEALSKEDAGYPINVDFINCGKGMANVMVINTDRNDININIGVPTGIGPGMQTNVKIWLNEANKREKLNLALYYWDIDDRCYRTELTLDLKYNEPYQRHSNDLYFVEYHDVVPVVEKNQQKPKEKILHWSKENPILFHPGFWEQKLKQNN